MRSKSSPPSLIAILAGAIFCSIAVASEQPPLSKQEHNDLVASVTLDRGERAVADAVYETYLRAQQRLHDAEDLLADWSQTHAPLAYDGWDPVLGGEMSKLRNRIAIRACAMRCDAEQKYFDSIGALAPEQEDVIAAFKRARLRDRWLGAASYDLARRIGLGGDLISAARALRDQWPEPTEQAIHDYERELDARLRGLEEQTLSRILATDSTIYMLQDLALREAEGADHQVVNRIDKYASDERRYILTLLDIRDLQKRQLERLADLMDANDARIFRLRMEPTLYPDLIATPDPLNALREALERPELNDQHREQLELLASRIMSQWGKLAEELGDLHESGWREHAEQLEERMTGRVYGTPLDTSAARARRAAVKRIIEEWKELAPSFMNEIESRREDNQ